jgi:hypothetical protein
MVSILRSLLLALAVTGCGDGHTSAPPGDTSPEDARVGPLAVDYLQAEVQITGLSTSRMAVGPARSPARGGLLLAFGSHWGQCSGWAAVVDTFDQPSIQIGPTADGEPEAVDVCVAQPWLFPRTPLGDQNGDGYSELIVGYQGPFEADWGEYHRAWAAIFFGPLEGVLTEEDADVIIGTDLPEAAWYYPCLLGIEPAGDVNADGIADLLFASAPDCSDHGHACESTALFYGPLETSRTDLEADWNLGDWTGEELDALGDVDGDGYDDFLVGGRRFWIFQGPVEPEADAADAAATLDLHLSTPYYLEDCVHAAGDVDGDGRADLLLGSAGEPLFGDPSGLDAGAARVLYGPFCGTLDQDDVDVEILGETPGELLGYSAAGLGDVDGDGFGDLLLGAPDFDLDTGYRGRGAAYLFLGPLQGSLRTSDADVVFRGEADWDMLGKDVLGPGDLDGDGLPDLAFSKDGNGSTAYVIFGRPDIVQYFTARAEP